MSPTKERILLAVAPRLAYAYIRLLRASMRLEWRGRERLEALRRDGGRFILALSFMFLSPIHMGERLGEGDRPTLPSWSVLIALTVPVTALMLWLHAPAALMLGPTVGVAGQTERST